MNELNVAASTGKHFRKDPLASPRVNLTLFAVTVVKVLHFVDGVKLYVGHSYDASSSHAQRYPTSWYFFSHLDFDWRLVGLVRRQPSLKWPSLVSDDIER
jgi:hypothetical protein